MKTLKIFILFFTIIELQSHNAFSQKAMPFDSALKDIGVAVSPSHINYRVKQGESKTIEVKVTNETRTKRSFKVTLKDFDMDKSGASTFMVAGTGEHSVAKWLSISPTFMELQPGAIQVIRVTLTVPDSDGTNRAAWCAMMVEEAKERQKLEIDPSDQKIAFGITPSSAFGIWIYQNPPNVAIKNVDIVNFGLQKVDNKPKNVELSLVNKGDGISSCTAYVELTNTNTGKTQRLLVKTFLILPGYTRNYLFSLPDKLEKGNYSAVGVLDYGSKDEVKAADLEFKVE